RRPRDILVMVSTSAGQAGAAWTAAKQIAQKAVEAAGPKDRISIWTVSTPEEKFTRCLTGDRFLSPKAAERQVKNALEDLDKQYPAGDTDLKNALTRALKTFPQVEERQRVVLYLGDGLSTHTPLSGADRTDLGRLMVERKINFFPVPLGLKLSPE